MQNVSHTKKNYATLMKTKLLRVFKSTGLVLLAFTFCKHLFVNSDKCFNIIHVVDFFYTEDSNNRHELSKAVLCSLIVST